MEINTEFVNAFDTNIKPLLSYLICEMF